MTTLHFLDPIPEGSKPVLMMHGLGADGSSWQLQFPILVDAGFRPLALDIPSFGKSVYDGKGWSIQRTVAAMVGLLDDLDLSLAHVVGISMGVALALHIALEFPERVDRLVLANTFFTCVLKN